MKPDREKKIRCKGKKKVENLELSPGSCLGQAYTPRPLDQQGRGVENEDVFIDFEA